MKALAGVLAVVSSLACGTPHEVEAVPAASTCAERLAPLRDELVWAESWRDVHVRADVAVAPQAERSVGPENVVELIDGLLIMKDDVFLAHYDAHPDWDRERAEERDSLMRFYEMEAGDKLEPAERRRTLLAIEQSQASPEWERAWERDAARDRERRVAEALRRAPTGPVALAIEHDEPWAIALPTLRAFAEHDGNVRLLVGNEMPGHWRSPFVDQLATESLADRSHALALRSTEVLAGCPAASLAFSRFHESFVGLVDGLTDCDCSVDLDASQELIYGLIIPMLGFHDVVELAAVTEGAGTPVEAEPSAPWSDVLPRLLAATEPVLLPGVEPEPPPPPPPPPPPSRRFTRPARVRGSAGR